MKVTLFQESANMQTQTQMQTPYTTLLSHDEDEVNEAWEKYLKWEQLADRKSFMVVNARKAFIACSLIGAALETLATQLTGNAAKIVGVIGTALLAAVPMLKKKYLTKDYKLDRVNCTAISEEIKSEVYQCRARIGVYAGHGPGHELHHNVARIIEQYSNRELDKVYRTIEIKDDEGELVPIIPDGKTVEEWYIDYRFSPSVKSLEDRILCLSKRSLFLDRLEDFFSIFAVAIAFLANSEKLPEYMDNRIGVWVPVATTAAAQVSKYTNSSTVDDTLEEWSKFKESLEDMKYHYFEDGENRDFAKFVSTCESTVGKELMQWKEIQVGGQSK